MELIVFIAGNKSVLFGTRASTLFPSTRGRWLQDAPQIRNVQSPCNSRLMAGLCSAVMSLPDLNCSGGWHTNQCARPNALGHFYRGSHREMPRARARTSLINKLIATLTHIKTCVRIRTPTQPSGRSRVHCIGAHTLSHSGIFHVPSRRLCRSGLSRMLRRRRCAITALVQHLSPRWATDVRAHENMTVSVCVSAQYILNRDTRRPYFEIIVALQMKCL